MTVVTMGFWQQPNGRSLAAVPSATVVTCIMTIIGMGF
jgi:hypothetical protein